jgi:5-amino-6-(5-phospho-D-ribitylamino)uracil phosphatase
VFRDANIVGHDYLVTGNGSLSANTRWWFEFTGARVAFHQAVMLDDLRHALRVGLVTPAPRMRQITGDLRRAFDGRIVMQSFEAVQMPDPEESVHVLEVFARGVDKWRGLDWVAQQHGIATSAVAAIGDEVNDVAMIQSAGCGIAMGNAIDAVKAVAHHVTLDRDDAGVAHAIEQLRAGYWE